MKTIYKTSLTAVLFSAITMTQSGCLGIGPRTLVGSNRPSVSVASDQGSKTLIYRLPTVVKLTESQAAILERAYAAQPLNQEQLAEAEKTFLYIYEECGNDTERNVKYAALANSINVGKLQKYTPEKERDLRERVALLKKKLWQYSPFSEQFADTPDRKEIFGHKDVAEDIEIQITRWAANNAMDAATRDFISEVSSTLNASGQDYLMREVVANKRDRRQLQIGWEILNESNANDAGVNVAKSQSKVDIVAERVCADLKDWATKNGHVISTEPSLISVAICPDGDRLGIDVPVAADSGTDESSIMAASRQFIDKWLVAVPEVLARDNNMMQGSDYTFKSASKSTNIVHDLSSGGTSVTESKTVSRGKLRIKGDAAAQIDDAIARFVYPAFKAQWAAMVAQKKQEDAGSGSVKKVTRDDLLKIRKAAYDKWLRSL